MSAPVIGHRLSVIVRCHDRARLPLLDEALFSLALQDVPDLEVVVALQRPDDDMRAAVEDLALGQPWLPGARCVVIAAEVPEGVDGRSRLLNEGLAAATGRYVAFLDDDDVVYHDCYTQLLERLRRSGRVIAIAGARQAICRPAGDHLVVEQKRPFSTFTEADPTLARLVLFDDNFVPIHSFVIDRAGLGDFELRFDEGLARAEDYELLLRLFARFAPDLDALSRPLVEYRLRTDGSNSVVLGEFSAAPHDARRPWEEARAKIGSLKSSLSCSLTLSELAAVGRALREARELRRELADAHAREHRALRALAELNEQGAQREPRAPLAQPEAAPPIELLQIREQLVQRELTDVHELLAAAHAREAQVRAERDDLIHRDSKLPYRLARALTEAGARAPRLKRAVVALAHLYDRRRASR